MATTVQTVPFAKLRAPSEINAREADGYDEAGIAELAALIHAKGLLQPLVVRRAPKGFFEIIAGKRRYLAIGKLITDLVWSVGDEVPVTVRDDDDAEALETSLIENIARQAMHPVQELEIFARIHADGADPRQIAKRYGVTELHVKQTLALGALAQDIRDAWRRGEITRDVAEAFAICPDPKKQVAGFKELTKRAWQGRINAHEVRQFFRKSKPSIKDGRIKLVGLEVYKNAGGGVVQGLFGDGYLEDEDLLDELTQAASKAKIAELLEEGWSWASTVADIKPSYAYHSWARVKGKKTLTPNAKSRLEAIELEAARLEDENDDDRHEDRLLELDNEKAAIEAEATRNGFSKKQKAEAGCIIFLDESGFRVEYGYLRKTETQVTREMEKAKKKKAVAAAIENGEDPPVEEPVISNALRTDITALQTKAVAEALAQSPKLAIRFAAAALFPKPSGFYGALPVRLTPDGLFRSGFGVGASEDDFEDEGDEDREGEWSVFAKALAEVPDDRASAILAVNLGRALDLRQAKYDSASAPDVAAVIEALPGQIYLKAMRVHFDAADYFERASIKVAIAALEEMGVSEFDRKAKKAAMAEVAATEATARGWLPEELRHPDYALFGAKSAVGGKKRKAA